MRINQEDLKKVVTAVGLACRLNELERQSPHIPSGRVSDRKSYLKKQLKKVLGEDEKDDKVINIEIVVPEGGERSEKKTSFSLKKLLGGNLNLHREEDKDEEPVVRIIRGLLPEEEDFPGIFGKIVREL